MNHIPTFKTQNSAHLSDRLMDSFIPLSVYISSLLCRIQTKHIQTPFILDINGCFWKLWYPQIIHFKRFSIINHPFWGTPILGNTQIAILQQPAKTAGLFLGWLFLSLPSTQPAPPAEAGDWPLTWRINLARRTGGFRGPKENSKTIFRKNTYP